MRVRLLPVPFVLAIVVACVGSDHFTGNGTGTGIGGQVGDAGVPDSGQDAGSDAGTTTDAGCNTQILPTGQVAVPVETCGVGGAGNVASINAVSCLDVTITVTPDGETCHGTVTGLTNKFSGTCTNTLGTCTSNNLPGIINCTLPSLLGCSVQVCADFNGTNCPP
jgi:hypothetical protein